MVSIVVVSYSERPNPTKRFVERFMVRGLDGLDGWIDWQMSQYGLVIEVVLSVMLT